VDDQLNNNKPLADAPPLTKTSLINAEIPVSKVLFNNPRLTFVPGLLPDALGAVLAESPSADLLTTVTCHRSNERGVHAGTPLRPLDRFSPTYSERSVLPYRKQFSRRDTISEREAYIGAFFESVLEGIIPNNLPLDIVAHGSLLSCPNYWTLGGEVTPWPADCIPDSIILYGNALSLALASCNVTEGRLFACARVVFDKGFISVNKSGTETAQAQMLVVCTDQGPHVIQYDTCAHVNKEAENPSVEYTPSLHEVEKMLYRGIQAATQAVKAQAKLLKKAAPPWSGEKWPSLLPSPRALDVLEDMAAAQVAKLLSSADLSRAQQLLELSKLEVRRLQYLAAGACARCTVGSDVCWTCIVG
jgi:hypothetical protein